MQSSANQKQTQRLNCDVLRLLNELIGHHRIYGDTMVFQLPARTEKVLSSGKESKHTYSKSKETPYVPKKSERVLSPDYSEELVSQLFGGQLKKDGEVTLITTLPGKTVKLTGKHVIVGNITKLHAAVLLRAMLEVIYSSIDDFHSNKPEDLLSPFHKLGSLDLADFVVCAKYWVSFPMAKYLHNDLPDRPSMYPNSKQGASDFLFTGKALTQLRNRLVARNNRNTELFLGILQGVKRAAKEVPENFVMAAMHKHKRALMRPVLSGLNEHMVDELDTEKIDISSAIDRVTDILGKTIKQAKFQLFEASTSSGVHVTRPEGGQREAIKRSLREMGPSGTIQNSLHDSNTMTPIVRDELLDFVETEPGKVTARHRDLWVPRNLSDLEEIIQNELRNPNASLIKSASSFPELENDVLIHKRKFVIPTKIASVLEPLKVRLVSSGEPLFYWVSRFMQKAMWNSLKNFHQFALTSEPLSENHFHILLANERKLGLTNLLSKGNEKIFWVSGDYSGATDNVEIRFTKEVFEQLLMFLDVSVDMKEILRAVLYEQEISYPRDYEKASPELKPFLQTGGQLMGSTLSFPILCVINFCCYIAAIEEFLGRKLTKGEIKMLPTLVNGDDILFRANQRLYEIWKRFVAKAGFFLSVGKNYVDPQYLMINSQMWKCVEDVIGTNGVKFEKCKWVNVGLLMAQSKSSTRNVLKDLPAEELYLQAVVETPKPLRLHKRFCFYNLPLIERLTAKGKFNLFLSREFGGLGFQRPSGLDVTVTNFQAKFANFLLHKQQQIYLGTIEQIDSIKNQIALVPKDNFDIPEVYLKRKVYVQCRQKTQPYNKSIDREGSFVERSFNADDFKVAELPLTIPLKPASEVEIKTISKNLLTEFKQKNFPALSIEKLKKPVDLEWVIISTKTAQELSADGVKIEVLEPKVVKQSVQKPFVIPSPDDLIEEANRLNIIPHENSKSVLPEQPFNLTRRAKRQQKLEKEHMETVRKYYHMNRFKTPEDIELAWSREKMLADRFLREAQNPSFDLDRFVNDELSHGYVGSIYADRHIDVFEAKAEASSAPKDLGTDMFELD